ncbi:MAG: FliH/SctL family protein [Alsobacter sp.]
MTEARRFTFDEEFTPDGRSRVLRRAEDVKRVQDAERDGFERGVIEGRRAAEQEAAMRTAQAAERIAVLAQAALARLDAESARLEGEAAELALAFARKVAGEALQRAPLDDLQAAAAECFRQLVGVPHIVVRVPQELVDRTKALLDRQARERGFEGRLVVLGEDGMGQGDFTIEWADGGMVRDRAALDALIGAAVARRFPGPAGSAS